MYIVPGNIVEIKYFGLAMLFPYMKYDNDSDSNLSIYKEELKIKWCS